MATAEERLAFVEGRVVEQGRAMIDLRDAVVSLERRMDQRFAGVEHRFAGVDQRFTALDQHVSQQIAALDQRISTLDARMAHQFLWVVGLQVTTIMAVVTALLVR